MSWPLDAAPGIHRDDILRQPVNGARRYRKRRAQVVPVHPVQHARRERRSVDDDQSSPTLDVADAGNVATVWRYARQVLERVKGIEPSS
jgi:hypothetical protein